MGTNKCNPEHCIRIMPTINISEYFLGGVAAMGACLFTNPLEVVKTRMQLQGELKAHGSYQRSYRNVFHAFYTIGRYDGVFALQKGLVPALWYQLFMNGIRLGTYQCIVDVGLTKKANGDVSFIKSVAAGAVSGCAGAFVGSPFYLIKTQLQAQASEHIAVGYQHSHSSASAAFASVLRRDGFFGLWRGVTGALPRVTIGSAVQLSTFSSSKEMVMKTQMFHPNSIFVPLFAGMASGVVVVCCMTPFDVISTRLYNQGVDAKGKGLYYSGFLDCFWKILTKEGPIGFYKGWSASWFRLVPHTILSLVIWEKVRQVYNTSIKKT